MTVGVGFWQRQGWAATATARPGTAWEKPATTTWPAAITQLYSYRTTGPGGLTPASAGCLMSALLDVSWAGEVKPVSRGDAMRCDARCKCLYPFGSAGSGMLQTVGPRSDYLAYSFVWTYAQRVSSQCRPWIGPEGCRLGSVEEM
jgi:hypothetical protein